MSTSALIETQDGSFSIQDLETGELYHNNAGAFTEALTHYVAPSQLEILLKKQQSVRVLDVCFGLGYNTWVLIEHLAKSVLASPGKFVIHVDCIERDKNMVSFWPIILSQSMFSSLNPVKLALEHNIYYQTLGKDDFFELTIPLYNLQCTFRFWFQDFRQQIRSLTFPVDTVFHDPFSPAKVPQLWTLDIFQEYARLLNSRQGRILTYSTATAVRGGLQQAGFTVYRTQPLGKKLGGTVGLLSPLTEEHYAENALVIELRNEEKVRLQTQSRTPYCDETFQAEAALVRAQRETLLREASIKQKKAPGVLNTGAFV